MFATIGRLAVRFRWPVIAAWAIAAVAGVVLMPGSSEFSMSTGFLAHGVESVDARHLMNEAFPEERGTASTALLVLEDPGGLTAADEDYARRVIRDVGGYDESGNVVGATSVFERPELRPNLVSPDGTTLLIPVGIATEAFSAETAASVAAIRDRLPEPPAGARILVSGDAGLGGDHAEACLSAVAGTAIVTLVLIALILLLVYRSPVAPIVPLLTIAAGAAVSLGIVGLLMGAGWQFSSFLQQFVIVIVFGAGTDYCLFMLSRHREELRRGLPRDEAVIQVMSRVGAVIASSAAIVVVGFVAFAFAEFEMFRTIGPGLALAVTITLLAGLTLVPALMAAISPRILFWPARIDALPAEAIEQGERTGAWGRLGGLVARAPGRVLLAGVVLLLVPALYLPSVRQTFEIDRSLPTSYESVEGLEIVTGRFDASEFLPIHVVARRNGGWLTPGGLADLGELGDRLAAVEGVTFVRSAVRPLGEPIPAEVALATPPALAAYVSADGTTARLMVGAADGTYTNAAYDTVRSIRTAAAPWAAGTGAAVLVGGASAESVDLVDAMNADTPRIVGLASVGVLVLIGLLLRSVVAPLYLLASVFLTVATTLAITAFVFQELLDFRTTGIDWTVPVFLLVLLIVLASDYSIFLMSRVKEETEGHGLVAGVRRGVAHTGGVISAAGIILAGTFGALALTPLANLIQTGFAIALGVLLDTFVVRPLVIPAITRLLGRWAWWPGPLFRAAAGEPAASAAARPGMPETAGSH